MEAKSGALLKGGGRRHRRSDGTARQTDTETVLRCGDIDGYSCNPDWPRYGYRRTLREKR